MKLDLSLVENLLECLVKSDSVSDKERERKKTFCNNNSTKPIPNSTADNTRNKNVKDNRLMLS